MGTLKGLIGGGDVDDLCVLQHQADETPVHVP